MNSVYKAVKKEESHCALLTLVGKRVRSWQPCLSLGSGSLQVLEKAAESRTFFVFVWGTVYRVVAALRPL